MNAGFDRCVLGWKNFSKRLAACSLSKNRAKGPIFFIFGMEQALVFFDLFLLGYLFDVGTGRFQARWRRNIGNHKVSIDGGF